MNFFGVHTPNIVYVVLYIVNAEVRLIAALTRIDGYDRRHEKYASKLL